MGDLQPADLVPALAAEPPRIEAAAPATDWPFAFETGPDGALVLRARAVASPDPAPQDPPLAMGLNGIADWTAQQPFVDVMKTARPWIGHLPGQWGGWDHAALEAGGYLDADGWPMRMPPELEAIATLILTDQSPDAVSLAGRYRLSYDGVGEVRVEGRATNVERRPGEIWFDYAPGEGFVIVTIAATDPRGVGDYVRNLRVAKAEDIDLLEAGVTFNPRWRDRIEDMRALRFMDWMATNGSPISTWAERPRPSDYTYAWRGAPVEVMVALADEIGADPWFTLPHKATDDYVQAFATYVRDHLDPRRKAYVEYSNEVWNWIFDQTQWAAEQAKARWGDAAGGDAWMQFVGLRGAEIAQIWDEVYGPESEARVVSVVATQTGWLGLEAPLLDAPLWVAEDPARNRPPSSYFDAYAVTGYFGYGLASERADVVRGWIAESRRAAKAAADAAGLTGAARDAAVAARRFDQAIATAAAELADGRITGGWDDSVDGLVADKLAYQARIARERGLELVMYEGGTHVVADPANQNDAELTAFVIALNYSPEMGALYARLIDGWRAVGGTLFNAFVDVAGPSKWGSWGALRHLDDANPRWTTLLAYEAGAAAGWETRAPDAFAGGAVRLGGAGPDALSGGPWADALMGRAGDDVLTGGGGNDRLHGGPGTDVAVLPGKRAAWTIETAGAETVATGPAGVVRLWSVETLRFADEPDAGDLGLLR